MNLLETLNSILKPETVTVGADFIAFDFRIKKELIFTGNLPEKVKALINSADHIEAKQHGSGLLGYEKRKDKDGKYIGCFITFEACAHFWSAEDLKEHAQYMEEEGRKIPHWHIESIGGKLYGENIQFPTRGGQI